MASLHTQYRLCSGLKPHDVIGIRQDLYPENVIATLGRNIAIVYKLSDQQVIRSWSTRQTQQFTAPVVVDPSSQLYIGVFENRLGQWELQHHDITKIPKHTFVTSIRSVEVVKEFGTFVVFCNGYFQLIADAIETKTEAKPKFLSTEESIDTVHIHPSGVSVSIAYVTKEEKITRIHLLQRKSDGEVRKLRQFVCSVTVNKRLLGICLTAGKDSLNALSLWDDGRLLRRDCTKEAPGTEEMGEQLHRLAGIDLNSLATLVPISPDHIAVCGSHPDNEGSILLIWNVKFGLPMVARKLKLVLNPKKLWAINSNLVMVIGHQLMVIPMTLEESRLVSVVGAAVSKAGDSVTVRWKGSQVSSVEGEGDSVIARKARVLLSSNGYSDAVVCKEVMSKLQSEQNLVALYECLSCLRHVSEDAVYSVLHFYLTLDSKVLQRSEQSFSREISEWEGGYCSLDDIQGSEETQHELLALKKIVSVQATNPFSSLKSVLVNQVLNIRISYYVMVKYLKNLELEYGLELLAYLLHLFYCSQSSAPTPSVVVAWFTMLLDCYFDELLLTSSASTHQMLLHISEAINQQMDTLDDLDKLEVIMKRFTTKKATYEYQGSYCVEVLKLY